MDAFVIGCKAEIDIGAVREHLAAIDVGSLRVHATTLYLYPFYPLFSLDIAEMSVSAYDLLTYGVTDPLPCACNAISLRIHIATPENATALASIYGHLLTNARRLKKKS